jgi:acetaldehyde dehydrogenase/alcohol dehydrogenase
MKPGMNIFMAPREIIWGRGSVQYLEKIPGKKALIVTDKVMTKIGAVAKVQDYLTKAGISSQVFDDVEPEFVPDTIMKMAEQYKGVGLDIIIGLGGGSALDAAKAFRVFYEYPELTFQDIWPMGGPPKRSIPPFSKTIFVAIPTTSGTGSEVTFVFVVSDPVSKNKRATASPHLIPNVAILDPDFTDSMPAAVQIDSGFDALSHAIPAYISNFSHDLSKACAIQSIRLIMQHLVPAGQGDKEAKEHMHYAACLAGKAFTNSGLGVEHYMSHLFGARFHISHGRACAIALPYTIQFNAAAAKANMLEIAAAVGFTPGNGDPAGYLVARIKDMMKQLGVPLSLREQGISQGVYDAELPGFIDDFQKSPNVPPLMSNPQKCTAENIKELFDASYSGKGL